MDKGELINNIKSKYILDCIFNYIKDKNFQLKLFLYSKKFQLKFGINLNILKEIYLQKIDFDLDKYLYHFYLFYNDHLSIEYNNFLKEKKLNKEIIESIIYDIFENKEIKDIDEEDVDKINNNEKLINIESPLFNILSKTKNFSKIFTIYIKQTIIDEYKLKENYIKFFENLNKLDIKYTSIYYRLKDINKLGYLKEININFNKIKRLKIQIGYAFKNKDIKNSNAEIIVKNFFDTLFSFNNIENNLIYLDINFTKYEVKSELFEKINNFKSLRYLYLKNIYFKKNFIFKLNELKLLSLQSCKNVKLSSGKLKELNISLINTRNINLLNKVNLKELNKLEFHWNKISNIDILKKVNLKELKELYLTWNNISNINVLEKVNFKDLKILNLFGNEISDINLLEKVNFKELKKLDLSDNGISDITILEKVNFKELKELYLNFNGISDITILEKVNFKELKELDLSFNKISDIHILEKVNFKELKELNLFCNNISDIIILEKVQFEKLEIFDLRHNKISDKNSIKQKLKIKRLNI